MFEVTNHKLYKNSMAMEKALSISHAFFVTRTCFISLPGLRHSFLRRQYQI